jgi:NTP pyrophosphatase (non-canonical NTP hydrolase)
MQEKIIELVVAERQRQIKKWGKQNQTMFMWLLILQEEMGEVAKAIIDDEGQEQLLTEAVQVAAVAVQICEWASDLQGWSFDAQQVLNQIFQRSKLSPGTPREAHLSLNVDLGTLSAKLNPRHDNALSSAEAEYASHYLRRIAFNACLLVHRLILTYDHAETV